MGGELPNTLALNAYARGVSRANAPATNSIATNVFRIIDDVITFLDSTKDVADFQQFKVEAR